MTTIIPTFEAWMARTDQAMTATIGLSIHDLADQPFYDWFTDGMTPAEAVRLTLEAEL